MILGIIKTDLGKIIINNENISFLPIYERAKKGISYFPQESSIFRNLTVYDNLLAIIENRKELKKTTWILCR